MDYAVNDTLRAMHAVDLPFFFARPDTAAAAEPIGPATPATAALRHRLPDEMAGGLLCFVRQGRPGWPQYDRAGRQTMIFGNAGPSTGPAQNLLGKQPAGPVHPLQQRERMTDVRQASSVTRRCRPFWPALGNAACCDPWPG